MTALDEHVLRIYMNDQLAAGVLWRELAWRAQRNNDGSELGDALARVAAITTEDVETFRAMMDRLHLRRNPAKIGIAVMAERVGRLKLNGHLRTYSPLSRFVELDTLLMGVVGKRILWKNLGDFAGLRSRLPDVDFDELLERAQAQIDLLEPFHAAAAREAFNRPRFAQHSRRVPHRHRSQTPDERAPGT